MPEINNGGAGSVRFLLTHRRFVGVPIVLVIILTVALSCLGGCGEKTPAPATGSITARELVEPNALVGPGPSILGWSPQGAALAYTGPQDGQDGNDVLWLYDASSGEKRVLLDPSGQPDNIDVTSAQWSPQGDTMLLSGDASLWLLAVASGELSQLVEAGASKTAMIFTPSGTHVSYVQDNDLYTVSIGDGQVRRITSDGSDAVFNGCLDWVYNEELATRAAQPGYAWSPDGKWLMYMRLDDSSVHNDPVTDYDPVPPTVSYTRYPTAGSPNPVVSMHAIAPEAGAQARTIPLPPDTEYILPFYTWAPDSGEALYITVNRDHSVLRLNAWSPASGASRIVIEETDPHWINEDFYAAPVFLEGGQRFLWLSERDGFMHLYLYSRQGEMLRQLTRGDWLIDNSAYDILTPGKPVHVDPSGTWAYFTTTANGPLERQVYRLDLAGGQLEQISQQAGFHAVALSGDGAFLVDQFSSVDTPPVTSILHADGGEVEVLGECAGPSLELPQVSREFLTVEAHDGTELYAQIVKPEDFDPDRKYGVVVHWYGGPGLQLVSDRYGTTNLFNHIERDTLYTQAGFIVWRLDNRGSFGRGHAFETPIYGQLGPAALDDQLAGVEYLKTLSYVDPERIGSDGKSFGGFLTLYALIHAPDVFRCGVAGSGPTDWSYYDTIYTERYMKTPAENPDGYAATELVSRAGDIGAEPLIVHGLADTNVHLQNSVNFIQALEHTGKPFSFIPLPNENHHYEGDGLATALSASTAYFTRQMGNP
jgi:dipeptidyl-peptidase-4